MKYDFHISADLCQLVDGNRPVYKRSNLLHFLHINKCRFLVPYDFYTSNNGDDYVYIRKWNHVLEEVIIRSHPAQPVCLPKGCHPETSK